MMDGLSLGLNVMTLGGLTVAIGVLVDDAIIDVENVFPALEAEPCVTRGSDKRDFTLGSSSTPATRSVRPWSSQP